MKLGNIMIFGDSYSTYEGYIPEGYAVYYSGHRERQPDVSSMEKTWWGRILSVTDSRLIENNSWSGSTIGYTGYQGDCSKTSSFIYRFENLLSKGFFKENRIDTLFVFGGTNDSWSNAPLGAIKHENVVREDLFSVLPAICYFARRLAEELPETRIVFIGNTEIKREITDAMGEVAKRYSAEYIELSCIEKIEGHPTETGMKQIASQVLNLLDRN